MIHGVWVTKVIGMGKLEQAQTRSPLMSSYCWEYEQLSRNLGFGICVICLDIDVVLDNGYDKGPDSMAQIVIVISWFWKESRFTVQVLLLWLRW